MQLIDKLILFNRFLRFNKLHNIDFSATIYQSKAHFTDQSRVWKDKGLYNEIDSLLTNMEETTNKYNHTLSKINDRIETLLRKEEIDIIRRDYDNFEELYPDLELQKQRQVALDNEFVQELKTDIGNFSDWRYAGLELNPSNGVMTNSLLSSDPMYVYTGNVADKDSIKSNFNSFFAEKRLMFYDNLQDLPIGQLGIITSILSFNFWPMDPIKDTLKQVYELLKPGGHFIFTYNDCEYEPQIDMCNGFASYNTATVMSGLAEMYGFDVIKKRCVRDTHSWMVVKKPGELTSNKLSGPLVEIKDKI